MAPGLTADCPQCSLPAQHCGMACGWCGTPIPMPGAMIAPDGTARVEEVIGWRGWRIAYADDGTPRLNSPMFALIWEPGEWMIATCRTHGNVHGGQLSTDNAGYHGPDATDPKRWSPVKGCGGAGHGCGFYAGRTRNHLIQLGYARYNEADPHVMGEVQMAGKIIPATNGYRAQKVRPRSILVPYEQWELCNALAAVYGPHGVNVELQATMVMPKGSLDWCQKCSAAMGRSPICPLCGHTHI